MCNLTGYKHWQEIFDESVSKVWTQEPIHFLKNLSMLYYSIDREIKKIQDTLQSDISDLRKSVNKSNFISDIENDNKMPQKQITKEPPAEPLKELSHNDSSSIIISEDEQSSAKSIVSSPEINKKSKNCVFKRRLKRRQMIKENKPRTINDFLMDISIPTISPLQEDAVVTPKKSGSDMDFSIVQCTPTPVPKKGSFANLRASKKKQQNSTLTQMCFPKVTKDNKPSTSKTKSDPTSPSSQSYSMLGITNMVSYLNSKTPSTTKKHSISLVSDDEGLNSGMIEDEDLNDLLAKAQSVPDQLEAAPVVRGKARQALPAWCCKDCERFYTRQGLTVDEILALSKQCSKHRGKYRPREDTLPGFWDMDIMTPADNNSL